MFGQHSLRLPFFVYFFYWISKSQKSQDCQTLELHFPIGLYEAHSAEGAEMVACCNKTT